MNAPFITKSTASPYDADAARQYIRISYFRIRIAAATIMVASIMRIRRPGEKRGARLFIIDAHRSPPPVVKPRMNMIPAPTPIPPPPASAHSSISSDIAGTNENTSIATEETTVPIIGFIIERMPFCRTLIIRSGRFTAITKIPIGMRNR